jgi:hypothetical protein
MDRPLDLIPSGSVVAWSPGADDGSKPGPRQADANLKAAPAS